MNARIIYDLEHEMEKDLDVIEYLAIDDIAQEFYAALCNMRWKKISNLPEDELIINKIMGLDYCSWSCTWRSASHIIAYIRNVHYNKSEDYMDFYCSGNEGIVSDRVNKCFTRMGWQQHPWDNDV